MSEQEEEVNADFIESLRNEIFHILRYRRYRLPEWANEYDYLYSVATALTNRLIDRWVETFKYRLEEKPKFVCYLSLEFLTGQSLRKIMVNLGLYKDCSDTIKALGMDMEDLADLELDAGLGNGGLGRLAACYLDSMSTVDIPAFGYGLRYDYGIFKQLIQDGYQIETPDNWLKYGNFWEIKRTDLTYTVPFYGKVIEKKGENGEVYHEWIEQEEVLAIAHDSPYPGFATNTINSLRLWSAQATDEFNLDYFNHGDYLKAIQDKVLTKTITKVLYPNDDMEQGIELRLKQEFFLVSATLQDIIKRHKRDFESLENLPEKVAVQLNDTHPSLAIPELMRLLMDIEGYEWKKAFDMTFEICSYTNHTVLPEALERWPVPLIGKILPRHLIIIYEINSHFLRHILNLHPNDVNRLNRMSIIEGGKVESINMAHLSIIGSHKINGVSKLHSEILKNQLFKDFYELFPERFTNVTNGITPRRWLKQANHALSQLITERIGREWARDLDLLKNLMPLTNDSDFRIKWAEAKRKNKERLIGYIEENYKIKVYPQTLFDCQSKRFHEYKRQLLNLLHVITLYNQIKENPNGDYVPRTVIFSGKAAPTYKMAKLIIKLINTVGQVINNDPELDQMLKVVFLPDYRVSLAEKLIPAADLSEQISTAGYEASGTGNMKYALNGALTIGTLDGANIEIKDSVGDDNIFIFGMNADEIQNLQHSEYNPTEYYEKNAQLKQVLDMIRKGYFNLEEPSLFRPIIDSLLKDGDQYFVLADYAAYIECQQRVNESYKDQDKWTKMSICNTANMGFFSADRAVKQYAKDIWGVSQNPVPDCPAIIQAKKATI